MKDIVKDFRLQMLFRPQGVNQHVGREFQSENSGDHDEMKRKICKFYDETVQFIQDRYGEELEDENES